MAAVIGKFHWDGCAGCVFTDREAGGCNVDEQELMDNLIIELDLEKVSCGCFKSAEGGAE